jgi:hypothetical protein
VSGWQYMCSRSIVKSLRALETFWLMADTARRATPTSTWFSNIQVAACLGLVFGGMRGNVVSRCSNEPLRRVAADGRWKVWIGEKLV